jgi:hypothetical protein
MLRTLRERLAVLLAPWLLEEREIVFTPVNSSTSNSQDSYTISWRQPT